MQALKTNKPPFFVNQTLYLLYFLPKYFCCSCTSYRLVAIQPGLNGLQKIGISHEMGIWEISACSKPTDPLCISLPCNSRICSQPLQVFLSSADKTIPVLPFTPAPVFHTNELLLGFSCITLLEPGFWCLERSFLPHRASNGAPRDAAS